MKLCAAEMRQNGVNMKSCISLYSYWKAVMAKQMTHYQAIDAINELGVDAVELQLFIQGVPRGETMASYAKALHAYAVEKGLEVPIFTVDSSLYCADPEAELSRLCSMVDIASELGIPLMRFDIAYKFIGDEPAKTPRALIETVAPYVRRLAEYAQEKGVKVCSENHGRIMQDSYRIEELFYQVNHANYGLLCDIGNFGAADEDYVSAVSKLLPHICFVHAKDSFTRSGMNFAPGKGYNMTRGGNYRRPTIFGHGDVPTYQLLHAIKRSGYDGYASIEYEGIEETVMAVEIGAENLKRMLMEINKNA